MKIDAFPGVLQHHPNHHRHDHHHHHHRRHHHYHHSSFIVICLLTRSFRQAYAILSRTNAECLPRLNLFTGFFLNRS
eukprot:6251647-Karenia_brevis.AAC.1